ncbi:hypothetical protein [Alkalihalobacillus sp. LMS39]|nr:hypothetical protein [Alkalihalobacillus sp. LMS39]UOE96050.1 hypothetical protein MM271_10815 [Alkalihalobacillus sp. LMS39]
MSKDIIVCKGRPQPSKEALDRFIQVYNRMVKENQEREKQSKQVSDKDS